MQGHMSQTQKIVAWVAAVLLLAGIVPAGALKLMGNQAMIQLFAAVGIGQWFRYFTGALEIGGSILALIPATAFWGAGLIACVMIGAIVTHLRLMLPNIITPITLLALALVIVWLRRPRNNPSAT
jgi:putative oxidoreductase